MARKLKTYVTSIGFFDLAIAAPSMKAALDAWGARQNLFHQGLAEEATDQASIEATLAKPGVVLRRPVGTKEPFQEHARLPKTLPPEAPLRPARLKKPTAERPRLDRVDQAAHKTAIIQFEQEKIRRDRERRREEVDRAKEIAAQEREQERLEKAAAKAEAVRDRALKRHEAKMRELERELAAAEERLEEERDRWKQEEEALEDRIRKARS
jgi:hypothetical protein